MAREIPDLWPNDLSGDHLPESPVSILRRQAVFLEQKTNDIGAAVYSKLNRKGPAFEFEHKLVIWPARRDEFSVELVKVWHGVEDYPLQNAMIGQQAKLKNATDFEAFLCELFHSPATLGLIHHLLEATQP